MDVAALRAELRRFDPEVPVAAAHTPPASWYLEGDVLELERRGVFRRHWVAVARSDEIAAPGSWLAGELVEQPWILVRDEAGVLRAFHNACRHHASRLAEGAGCGDQLRCPYHGWTYGLDGRLRSTPHMGGAEDFDRADHGLVPLAVREWCGLVLVRLGDGDTADQDADLDEVARRLDAMAHGDLRPVARQTSVIDCNWKVFVDNYLDGGYHVREVHPELAAGLELSTYGSELLRAGTLQSCAAKGGRLGERALYAWLHPNLMLNRYGPVLDVNRVYPRGPHRTEVVFDFFFDASVADDEDYVQRCLASSAEVQREDVWVSENVQAGLRSPAYDRGRYAPSLEGGMHLFHRLLWDDLRVGLEAPRGS